MDATNYRQRNKKFRMFLKYSEEWIIKDKHRNKLCTLMLRNVAKEWNWHRISFPRNIKKTKTTNLQQLWNCRLHNFVLE